MDVFDLSARLTLDSTDYKNGLSDAQGEASSFSSKLGGILATGGKVAGVAIAGVTTAVVGATTAMAKGISETASYGDTIDKQSQKLGLSTQAYQKWDYVLNLAGTSMQNMGTGLKTLTNKIDDAKNGSADAQAMFSKLGISMDDLATMSREDVFSATIAGFQGMADSTERASLANDLFGKSGQELTPLFNTTAESTQELMANLEDMGAVMSDEAVKASADFQDALTTLGVAINGLKHGALSEFLPSITSVMDGLTQIFSGDGAGVNKINDGIDSFIAKLTESLPKVMDVGAKITINLADAILTNLPKIMETGTDVIMTLVDSLIKGLPKALGIGLQVITTVANGITQALPELIPQTALIIAEVVNGLSTALPELIKCAMDMILAIGQGLFEALPLVIQQLPTIIQNLVDAIVSGLPLLIEGAISLIIGIVDALPDIIISLVEALPYVVSSIVTGLMECLPQLILGAIDLVIALTEHMPEIILALIEAIPEVIASIVDAFKDFPEKAREIAEKFNTSLKERLSELPAKIWEVVVNVFTRIAEFRSKMQTKATEVAKDFLDKLIAKIKELPSKLWEWLLKTIDKVKSFGKDMIQQAKETAENFAKDLIDGVKAIPDKMLEIGGNIVQGLKDGIANAWDSLTSWVSDKATGLIDGVKGVFGIASPSKKFRYIGEMCVAGFEDGSEGIFSDDGLEAKVSADIKTNATVSTQGSELARIESLLAQYLPQIGKDIVLNTGALVGGIAGDMDIALGQAQLVTARGI